MTASWLKFSTLQHDFEIAAICCVVSGLVVLIGGGAQGALSCETEPGPRINQACVLKLTPAQVESR